MSLLLFLNKHSGPEALKDGKTKHHSSGYLTEKVHCRKRSLEEIFPFESSKAYFRWQGNKIRIDFLILNKAKGRII